MTDRDALSATAAVRRHTLAAAGVGLAAALVTARRAEAATVSAASQNVLTYGADPTGASDSAAAFNMAFSKLPSYGGTINVPAGRYFLASALTFMGKPLTIKGEGSATTVLVMGHTGVGITFTSTAGYPSWQPFSLIGLSIAGPPTGNIALGAVVATYQYSSTETGYQYVFIDDVSIGNALENSANGCNIQYGLTLQNIWKSVIRNVRMFGSPGSVTFANLTGTKNVDIVFEDCISDGVYYGVTVSAPTEGLSLIKPVFICGVGIDTSGAHASNGINVLGLYIQSGEINSNNTSGGPAANLVGITQGYIADTHFGCSNTAASSVVNVSGSLALKMSNCYVSGGYSAGGPGNGTYGIILNGNACSINDVCFGNLAHGLQFAGSSAANLALGLQLIDELKFPRMSSTPAAVDNSSTLTNNAQWLTPAGSFQTIR